MVSVAETLNAQKCHSELVSESIYINPESSSGSETLKLVQGDNIVFPQQILIKTQLSKIEHTKYIITSPLKVLSFYDSFYGLFFVADSINNTCMVI